MKTAGKVAISLAALALVGGGAYLALRTPATDTSGPALPQGSGSSPSILDKIVGTTDKVQNAASTVVKKLYPAGTLVRRNEEVKVYQIDAQGYKHWITTKDKFLAMGLSFDSVKKLNAIEFAAIPDGPNISGLLGFNSMSLR
jgi:hypothetical protein